MKRLPVFPPKLKAFIDIAGKVLWVLFVISIYALATISVLAGIGVSNITLIILGSFLILLPLVQTIASRNKPIDSYSAFDFTIYLALIPLTFAAIFFILINKPIGLRNMNGDRWIALFSAMITYVGTCFLGVIAFIQNKNARATNLQMLDVDKKRNLHTIMTPTFIGLYLHESNLERATLEMASLFGKYPLCSRTFCFQTNFKTSNEYAIKNVIINSMRITLPTGVGTAIIYKLEKQTILPSDDGYTIRNTCFSPNLDKIINYCIISPTARFQLCTNDSETVDPADKPTDYDFAFPPHYPEFKVQMDLTSTNIFQVSVNTSYHFSVAQDNSNKREGVYNYKVIADDENIFNMSINDIFTENLSKPQQ